MERYSHSIGFQKIGKEGQEKMKGSKIAIVGVGGIGCPAGIYLCQAGIGKLVLIDRDFVDLDNLPRQVLYNEKDVGSQKAFAAKKQLQKMNSDVDIVSYFDELNKNNIDKLMKGVDLIIDGTDNMKTRFLINEWSVKNNVPFIYAGSIEDHGMLMLVNEKPCLKCLIPKEPKDLKTCQSAGVLSTAVGIAGLISATIALKHITGLKNKVGEVLQYNVSNMDFEKFNIKQNENCEVCVKKKFDILNSDEKIDNVFVFRTCSVNGFQGSINKDINLDLEKVVEQLKESGFKINFQSDDLIKSSNITIFQNGRILMQDVKDKESARESIKNIYKIIGITE